MTKIYCFLALLLIEVVIAEPQWYNSSDGRQYLIESAAKYNWFRANHECSRRNLQLVEIQSESKNQALVQLLKNIFGKSTSLWLGGNDQFNTEISTNRPFYWSASGKTMTYSYWYPGEPNNERNQENCVQTFAYSPEFQWNDVSCSNQYGFICEHQRSHNKYSATLQEKRQHVVKAMKKFSDFMQHEKEKMLDVVHRTRNLIAKNNNEVEHFLEALENKASHSASSDEKENKQEITRLSSDINDHINELYEKLENSTPRISNRLSQELTEVEQKIEDVLRNVKL
ncbi:lectin subunit alpha-like [Musca vetustissima]|uniref:lectin subunit alpha-like n=1 Tax=Musca vetustissima TaxID=27455 RepID=UPI002AB5DFE8|nr:lectin subunit alpha-like [Musca vetustissima]